MIKIRLMGKKEDMHEMIKKIYQIKDIEVMELSDLLLICPHLPLLLRVWKKIQNPEIIL